MELEAIQLQAVVAMTGLKGAMKRTTTLGEEITSMADLEVIRFWVEQGVITLMGTRVMTALMVVRVAII